MNWLFKTTLVLVVIGAINWLLIGMFQWDLVAAIFGGNIMGNYSWFSRTIFILVGLSGLYLIPWIFRSDRRERPALNRPATNE